MKKILFIFCSLVALQGYAQNNIVNVDQNRGPLENREFYATGGFPLSNTKYIKVSGGSPYLSETWMKGAIEANDGTEYSNLRLRLDLLDNSVVYLNAKNEEMVAVAALNKITLRDTVTGKTYLFVHSSAVPGAPADKTWYEVLVSGKVTLYKQHFKDMVESKAYGSSITEQRIRTSERYFVGVNNTFTRIKKPKEIVDLVTEKKTELNNKIQEDKLSGKKDSDYITAVEYYNSL